MMKWWRHSVLVIVLAMAPLPAFAQATKVTLEEALAQAFTANRDIQVARQRLAELDGLKGEARAMGLPHLTATGSYQRLWRKPEMFINGEVFTVGSDNAYTVGAEVDQLLFDGGKVVKAVRAAKTEKMRGIENLRDAEAQVRLSVKQTFYQILYLAKVIDVLDRQLAQLKAHLASIQTRYNKGIDSDYTLMRQQVEVSNIEPQLIEAQRARALMLNGLKILMAVAPEEEIEPVGALAYAPRKLPEVSAMIDAARSARPDLKAEQWREKSLVENVGIEKAGYWPTLNFNTAYQWQGQSNNWHLESNEIADALSSTFSLSWPIFDGLKTRARVKQAEARLLQQQFANSQLADSVVRDAQDAVISLEKAMTAYRSQQGAYDTARRASAIAGERFEAGLMSQLELNDTINAQAQAEQLYLRSVYECLSAEAVLEKAVGGMYEARGATNDETHVVRDGE